MGSKESQAFDVIGIGALNADFVVTKSAQAKLEPGPLGELTRDYRHGSERRSNKNDVLRVLEIQEISQIMERRLGGSAFNTIRTISTICPNARLGMIGLIGNALYDETDFENWFRQNSAVDREFALPYHEEPQGVCVSGIESGDRKLRTFSGANDHFASVFGSQRDELVTYLCRARYIHLTSFFDEETPNFLGQVLREVKNRNPLVTLCIDPGDPWTNEPSEPVIELFRLADYIFLNEDEFRHLGRKVFGEDDKKVAERIINEIANDAQLIVVKRYQTTMVYFNIDNFIVESLQAHIPLRSDEIEDPTGAGDVFAAGFLTTRLHPIFDFRDSISTSVQLAQEKIRVSAAQSPNFRRIYESAMQDTIYRVKTNTETVVSHAADFSSITVGEKAYRFAPSQRTAVELLYRRWLEGAPSVSKAEILEAFDAPSDRGLANRFQRNEAWTSGFIKRTSKDTYALNLPDALRPAARQFEDRLLLD